MQWATGMQFYNVIANQKVTVQHIYAKYCKCTSFQVTTDLLNSENLKIASAQLWNKLQVFNFSML